MQMRRGKKLAIGGVLASGAVMAGASAAFACVAVVGQITVQGSVGTSRSVANGNHPGTNVFCTPPTVGAAVPAPTGFSPSARPDVTVTLGSAASSACPTRTVNIGGVPTVVPNAFGDATYEVMFCNGTVFKKTGGVWDLSVNKPDRGSCFFTDGVGDRAVLMGTMVVSAGTGSKVFDIPGGDVTKTGPNNAAGISVRELGSGNPGAPHVNIAAISII